MASPTFQSNNVISLKEDLFKQNKGYVEVNLSLRDVNRKAADQQEYNFQRKIEESYLMEHR